MKTMLANATVVLTALTALTGCAVAPRWEAQFGSTVRQAQAQQLVDPGAAARPAPPQGLDGKAVAGAQRDYAEAFDHTSRGPKSETRERVNPR